MKKLTILITMPEYGPTYQSLLADPNLDMTPEKELAGGRGVGQVDWPIEWFCDIELLFSSGVMPRHIVEMKSLRWVQLGSTGYEQAIHSCFQCLRHIDTAIAE